MATYLKPTKRYHYTADAIRLLRRTKVSWVVQHGRVPMLRPPHMNSFTWYSYALDVVRALNGDKWPGSMARSIAHRAVFMAGVSETGYEPVEERIINAFYEGIERFSSDGLAHTTMLLFIAEALTQ